MTLSIIGAGQLARYLGLAAHTLGIPVNALSAELGEPVQNILPNLLLPTNQKDGTALKSLLKNTQWLTFETENLTLEMVNALAKSRPLYPSLLALETFQDRLFEKNCFVDLGIPTTEYVSISSMADLKKAVKTLGLPLILKTRTSGYDGKGQVKITCEADLTQFDASFVFHHIAEKLVSFDREVSIIAARDQFGETVFYDLCENTHIDGILFKTQPIINDPSWDQAKSYISRLLDAFEYRGIMTLEFFETQGKLMANEVAPRVHNSGHWTLQGALTSQFENHVRAVCGLPVKSTQQVAPCVMYNLISTLHAVDALKDIPCASVCTYNKSPKPNRKLGHITLVKDGLQDTLIFTALCEKVENILKPLTME